jgi:hypothetical protein
VISTQQLTRWTVIALLLAATPFAVVANPAAQSSKKKSAPETFNARAQVTAAEGAGDAYLTIQVDRYSAERDIQTMEAALKTGGSDAFLAALRKAPLVGHVKVGEQTFPIRWARERPTENGRIISLVTDAPVYFVGGGIPGAKGRAGFDVAVLQLNMDSSGLGRGSMAPAARVKPGAETGVEVEDYGEKPVTLHSISRVIS